MRALVFQLFGPLAAWGEVAVGQVRPSAASPGPSALIGLIGAALGVPRSDERWGTLAGAYAFAVEIWEPAAPRWAGRAEWDFHTVQTVRQATLKAADKAGEAVRSRRDALALDTYTFTSRREHRFDGYWRAVAVPRAEAPFSLDDIRDALRAPAFPLFLGRRACPPTLPLDPQIVDADPLVAALRAHPPRFHQGDHPGARALRRLAHHPVALRWDADLDVGLDPHETVERRDAVLSRRRWQFATRREHVAPLQPGD